jgi:hypothetical protein
MEVKGSIYKIEETIVVSDKFKKRDFIVKVEGTYPQFIPMQVTQDKIVMLDDLAFGQNVSCHINLKGRLWDNPTTGKQSCFLTLECWKLEVVGEKLEKSTTTEQVDDLPF